MSTMNIDTEVEKIKRRDTLYEMLQQYEHAYYVLSNPIVSDATYDSLYNELKALEKDNPELITTYSPTQRIGQKLSNKFEPVNHTVPMISLDNAYSEYDLQEFDRRLKELTNKEEALYTIEPKYDGSSIALTYENDILIQAATRGNGTQGENITANAKTIKSIPLKVPFSKLGIYKIEIRGEVVITKSDFVTYNKKQEDLNAKIAANPRNFASGSLRSLDPNEVAQRKLTAILYHVAFASDKEGNLVLNNIKDNHFAWVEALHNMGFKTPYNEMRLCQNINQLTEEIQAWDLKRDNCPIEIDGMVIKLNSLHEQILCGQTSHHPRWAIAYKFKAKEAHTTLEKIEYQIGRTGAVTPVAKVTPVQVGGVTISSISLFNQDYIAEKDIRINDTVCVARAGDVIPYISHVVKEKRKGNEEKVIFPSICPICNSTLNKPEDEAVMYCNNYNCSGQVVERLKHYCSKNALDIEGLGEKTINEFNEKGFLNTIQDLYRLPYEEIEKLKGYGQLKIDKIKQGIENAKKQSIDRLLFALGIRYVGETTAKQISKEILSLNELLDKSIDDLLHIENVGDKAAQSIFSFFSNENTKVLLSFLENEGVNMYHKNQTTQLGHTLENKTFLFTGTLTKFTRTQAEQLVESQGGKVLSGVSAKLHYLVAGENAGSKIDKAKKINTIQIISETEFEDMLT